MENEEIIETPIQEAQEEKTTETPIIEEVIEEKRETLKLPETDDVEIDGVKYPKELIEKAKLEGWRDKSFLEKTGKDNRYLDPKTFVERGEKAVPFLNKKLDKMEKENLALKEMFKKQFSAQVKDRMENVEKQIKEAKDYGEYDNVEKLIEKKIELKDELANYSKEEIPEQPQIQSKPIDLMDWESRNDWCVPVINGMSNPNFNPQRQSQAQVIFNKISSMYPEANMKTRLEIVDSNLTSIDNKSRQKANLTPPIQGSSTSAITPSNSKTFENLTQSTKRIFDEACVGIDGKPFTGEAMKIAKASFLERCGNESFKK